ncbi:hypothetical protein EYF80_003463 [Liparis tanakae]|uniref:Uncharacterized protein n=1 Tax=Liparis tanakae TaxID=230148 RepID=A0A4Z2J9M1_9TELE|nr:hypothetical protein EYF80_003463 [Liparis tanakae]
MVTDPDALSGAERLEGHYSEKANVDYDKDMREKPAPEGEVGCRRQQTGLWSLLMGVDRLGGREK